MSTEYFDIHSHLNDSRFIADLDDVLALENGHRPVLPNAVRVFDAWCCGADQSAMTATALALSAGSFALLLMGSGAAFWFNSYPAGPWMVAVGFALLVFMLFGWFGTVIGESEGHLYNKKGNFEQALTYYEALLKAHPNDAEIKETLNSLKQKIEERDRNKPPPP